jgi:hypothetical protein
MTDETLPYIYSSLHLRADQSPYQISPLIALPPTNNGQDRQISIYQSKAVLYGHKRDGTYKDSRYFHVSMKCI